MDKLNKYFDLIINEYASKPFDDAYYLDVESIPHHELIHLIERMMSEDTKLRDTVMSTIQNSIDNRLPEFESEHRYWKAS